MVKRAAMPRSEPRNALAANARIVTGILIRQRVVPVGVVQGNGLFGVLFGGSTLGPEHVMRLDGNAWILHQLHHFGATQANRLSRTRMPADHVVLGSSSQCGKAF